MKGEIIGIIFTIIILLFATAITSTSKIINENNNTITQSIYEDGYVPYDGELKIYIVEPVSRWNDYDNKPYKFGFLDFALEDELLLQLDETYTAQTTWNAQDSGFNSIEENNIFVIVAVFNPNTRTKYSQPPAGNPFKSRYVDAAAAAYPGEIGQNVVNENFSHTIFCEQATATYCPYCPDTADALYSIYSSQDFPFFYTAMIGDENNVAYNHLSNNYNLYGYPTCYFDGGFKVSVGTGSESSYKTRIQYCGARDVHELDLSLSVEWDNANGGTLIIEIEIKNNELLPNSAPKTPAISGPNEAKYNLKQDFTFSASDTEGDQIYYCIDWGDESGEDCIGPYESGEEITESHKWNEQGNYLIKVKSRDIHGAESDWKTFELNIMKSKITKSRFFDFMMDFCYISNYIKQIIGLME